MRRVQPRKLGQLVHEMLKRRCREVGVDPRDLARSRFDPVSFHCHDLRVLSPRVLRSIQSLLRCERPHETISFIVNAVLGKAYDGGTEVKAYDILRITADRIEAEWPRWRMRRVFGARFNWGDRYLHPPERMCRGYKRRPTWSQLQAHQWGRLHGALMRLYARRGAVVVYPAHGNSFGNIDLDPMIDWDRIIPWTQGAMIQDPRWMRADIVHEIQQLLRAEFPCWSVYLGFTPENPKIDASLGGIHIHARGIQDLIDRKLVRRAGLPIPPRVRSLPIPDRAARKTK